jgi:hypothetical protein
MVNVCARAVELFVGGEYSLESLSACEFYGSGLSDSASRGARQHATANRLGDARDERVIGGIFEGSLTDKQEKDG